MLLLERLPNLSTHGNPMFKVLLRGRRRLRDGHQVFFPESRLVVSIVKCNVENGEIIASLSGVPDVDSEIERIGHIPLPPYIKNYSGDLSRYQTIFARIPGSVAAPTAGLHFTPKVFARLLERGIDRAEIHLRVGWGTFSPIRTDKIEEHKLHAEEGTIDKETADKINATRAGGGRIIAVGTTVTRLLETATDDSGIVYPFDGPTNLFITPGYRFKAVDILITNFHLPKTSLLALVASFAGTERILEAYRFAVAERFRFYSFGDAMIVT